MELPNPETRSASQPFQFSLQMLFWLTFNVGMAMAYLRSHGPEVLGRGLLTIGGALLAGVVFGRLRRRTGEATFWAVLSSACALLGALDVPLDWAWGAVEAVAGAVAGALAGSPRSPDAAGALVVGKPLRTAGATALAGLAVFGGCVLLVRPSGGASLTFDLVGAPIVGGLLGILVEVITALERRGTLPRYITASVLLLAVIVGDLLARRWVR